MTKLLAISCAALNIVKYYGEQSPMCNCAYGCIITDQSCWSNPASSVFMTPDLESSDFGSHLSRDARLEVFIYRNMSRNMRKPVF